MILPDLVSNNSNKKVKSQKQTRPFSTWSVHYQMIPLVVESMVATWMAESKKLHLLDRQCSIVIHTSIPSSSTTKGKADNQDKLQTSNLGSHKKTKSIRVSGILDSFDMSLHFSFFSAVEQLSQSTFGPVKLSFTKRIYPSTVVIEQPNVHIQQTLYYRNKGGNTACESMSSCSKVLQACSLNSSFDTYCRWANSNCQSIYHALVNNFSWREGKDKLR
jgi:hypothetical protein